jgi:integrase
MPTTEKRGRRHRGIAFHQGKRLPVGTFATKAEAFAAAVEIEKRAKAGQLATVSDKTVGDMLERYSDEVSVKKPGCKWEQTRIKALLRHPITRKRLAEATSTDFAAYRDQRLKKVLGSTVDREFNLISAAYTIARKEWRWIDYSPLKDVARPPDEPPRERVITPAEVELMCHTAGYVVGDAPETVTARVAAALVFAIETGMRGGEICALRPGDLFETYVFVAGHPGAKKTDAARRNVPLSSRARLVLDGVKKLQFDPVWGLESSQREALFRKIRDRAGVVGCTFHDSRHTAITNLSRKIDVLALARMVGHKDIRMLLRYYNPTATELAARLD